jgi:hypothetical protein
LFTPDVDLFDTTRVEVLRGLGSAADVHSPRQNRYTRDRMRRQLWACAVAAVVAGGPAAAVLCQVACHSHEMNATAHSSHQHSHAALPRFAVTAMSPAAHKCEAPVDDTLAIQQTTQSLMAPADVAVHAFACQLSGDVGFARLPRALDESPPGLLALTTHLRV